MKKPSTTLRTLVIVTAAVAVGAFGIAALIAAATGFHGLVFSAGYPGTRLDEEKVIPAAGAARVEVKTSSIDVRISVSPDSSVHARLTGVVGDADPQALPRLTAGRSADNVIAIQVERRPELVLGFSPQRLSLDVAVPQQFPAVISVDTSSGEVRLDGPACDSLFVSTRSGDVTAGAIDARNLTLRTTSGNIRVEAARSAVAKIGSSSGDCILGSATGELSVTTSSGEVSVRFSEPPKGVEAQSGSGDVTLAFPPESVFVLDARSTSGDVTCDFPVTMSVLRGERIEHELKGAVGSGTAVVKIRTSSGDVKIRK